ncbi:hypothetical protein GF402_03555 [Candidatus Fermentibacteria bacterium]|nr:hypothetical protein [Candidatus Fermentibacteria bacterium]
MRCRICGHENGRRDKGRCENCGFDLGQMNLPLKEQRSALHKKLDKPVTFQERVPLRKESPNRSGWIGVAFFVIGLIGAIYVVRSFEQSHQVIGRGQMEDIEAEQTGSQYMDSLPIRMGTDLVYEMNREGTSAAPHTNLDLNMMPQGSTVGILGHRDLLIKPVAVFIEMKRMEVKGNLKIESLICWEDTTESSYSKVPLFLGQETPEDSLGPVEFRLIFMDEWLVGRVEEFNIDVPAPVTGGRFSQAKFDSVLYQVGRRLDRRSDIDDRTVQVTAMFDDETRLGEAMDILQNIQPPLDSLGYKAFNIKYFRVEQ